MQTFPGLHHTPVYNSTLLLTTLCVNVALTIGAALTPPMKPKNGTIILTKAIVMMTIMGFISPYCHVISSSIVCNT